VLTLVLLACSLLVVQTASAQGRQTTNSTALASQTPVTPETQAPSATGPVQPAPAPPPQAPQTSEIPRSGGGPAQRLSQTSQGGLVFSLWDRSPLDAIERNMGMPSGHTVETEDGASDTDALLPEAPGASPTPPGAVARKAGSRLGGGRIAETRSFRDGAPREFNMNQLARASAHARWNSSLGSIGLTGQDGMRMRANSPGAMRPGATFTSAPLDNRMYSFSSVFNLGSGASIISTPSGLSLGYLKGSGMGAGKAGPGIGTAGKQPAASLSVKLSF
jgi:hypothetical protein